LDQALASPYKGLALLRGRAIGLEKKMNGVTRFFGGSPARVLAQLVLLSLVVGVVLSALGVSPFDIVNGLTRLVRRIYDTGFESVAWIWRYFLLGAVIVFPVWLIMRVMRLGRRRGPEN
jgi:hypothetical protein